MTDGGTTNAVGRQTGSLTYDDALRRVMGLADFERSTHSPGHASFHLERIGLTLDRLSNPHLGIPTVHVAGTKGKGSTAAMVASILRAEGYTVGLYTSPHLHSAVERIRVGLDPIGKPEFAGLVEQTWPAVQTVSKEGGFGDVTTFEMLTAMAFVHFRNIQADVQVIEVGLGGRLDCTNVVEPKVSIITSISLDHVETLGDSIRQIAGEKAGIIKDGVPVVVAPQPPEAMAVFRDAARRRGATIIEVGSDVSWRNGHRLNGRMDGQDFFVKGLRSEYELTLPLLGPHQLENASSALAAAELLNGGGLSVAAESIVNGFRAVEWPARFEVLSNADKLVVVDGAHNQYSMKRLVEGLRHHARWGRSIVVFGALSGHNASRMLDELAVVSPSIIAAQSRHPRSMPSGRIADAAAESGLQVLCEAEDVGSATRRALEAAGEGDMVLGTGSLSVAAEIIEEIRGVPAELYPYVKRPAPRGRRAVERGA